MGAGIIAWQISNLMIILRYIVLLNFFVYIVSQDLDIEPCTAAGVSYKDKLKMMQLYTTAPSYKLVIVLSWTAICWSLLYLLNIEHLTFIIKTWACCLYVTMSAMVSKYCISMLGGFFHFQFWDGGYFILILFKPNKHM